MNNQITASTKPALPKGWVEMPLGELAQLLRGVSYEKTAISDTPKAGYLPLLRATNIQKEGLILDTDLVYIPAPYIKAEQLLRPGDVVICMSSGSRQLVGKTAQFTGEWQGAFGAFCAVARFKVGIDQKFAGYFFSSIRYRDLIQAKSSGVNINNLRYADLAGLPIPIPPLDEQERIAFTLDRYFARLHAGITALRRVQVNLRRYKAAILKAAGEGRLIPQNPSDEPATYLLQRLLAERQVSGRNVPPPPHKPDLPALPEGWCWANLAAISHVLAGYAFQSKDYAEAGFQIVKIGNVGRGHLNLAEKPAFIRQVEAKIEEKYLLQDGDLLITLTGTRRKRDYGWVALVENEEGLLLNQRVARLRFQPPLNPKFFWIALQGEYFQNRFFQYETGNTGQGNVRMAALTREIIPLPPLAEQDRIVAELERRLAAAERLEAVVEANLKRAERLGQAILEQAFMGRLSFTYE